MKLMSYNILDGGENRLPLIINAIKKEHPDYLTINEANSFAKNENKILQKVSQDIGLPYFDIAISGEYDYHVAVYSKYPLRNIHKLTPLMRACIVSLVDTELGELSIASLHLTPYSEDLRHPEIDTILHFQKQHDKKILMGDMNSLSKNDNYDKKIIDTFNETQLKKFTTNKEFRFDAIDKILSSGYKDIAVEFNKNSEPTVPTPINTDSAHTNMRLDYIFVSTSLVTHLKDYGVIKSGLTNKASDHYPIFAVLE